MRLVAVCLRWLTCSNSSSGWRGMVGAYAVVVVALLMLLCWVGIIRSLRWWRRRGEPRLNTSHTKSAAIIVIHIVPATANVILMRRHCRLRKIVRGVVV